MINSSKAIENIKNVDHGIQNLPESERQIRPLTKLEPNEQKEAWEEAINGFQLIQQKGLLIAACFLKNEYRKASCNKPYKPLYYKAASFTHNKTGSSCNRVGTFISP